MDLSRVLRSMANSTDVSCDRCASRRPRLSYHSTTNTTIIRLFRLPSRPSLHPAQVSRPRSQRTLATMSVDIDVEECKRAAARQAVKENFPADPRFVGIGSGSTIVYVIEAIIALEQDVSRVCFVPTGYQSREVIVNSGLVPIYFDSLPEKVVLDICFDGADEVDEELNCIKGGGACLFQEKLVAMRSKKFICVAGQRTPNFIPALSYLSPSLPPTSNRKTHN